MDRIGSLIYRLFEHLVRPLSIAAAFRLGSSLGWAAYWLAAPYRKLALHNLGIAFPELPTSGRRAIAKRHFSTLGGNLLTGLKFSSVAHENLNRCVEFSGIEVIEDLVKRKQRFVFATGHIGNWEIFAQILPSLFPPRAGTIYQRLGNAYIDGRIRETRARLGVPLFERKEGFQGAIQTLRAGSAVCILIDQHAGDSGLWCPLFGRLASTTPLAATMALRTGAVLVSGCIHTLAPGKWRLVVDRPLDPAGRSVDAITAELNRALETQIRASPADWLWVHNRWKTPRPKFLLATYKRPPSLGAEEAAVLQRFRMVIRSPNWLGDAVMCVPAVRAIKRGRPDAHVTILVKSKLADLWRAVPDVDEIIEIRPGISIFGVAKMLRNRFDAAVVFPNSIRSAMEVWLAAIPRRAGFPAPWRDRLLNQIFREKKKKLAVGGIQHQAQRYLKLAEFIGAEIEGSLDFAPRCEPSNGGPRRIAVCPGAEYGPAKRWLPERFAEVMARISASRACEWVLVGVARDAPIGAQIEAASGVSIRNLIGATSLAELISELRQCDLLLTNDTGTMHLASLLRVPVAAIFGSTEPALTGPLGGANRIIRRHVSCSPCFLRECPIDFRCMREVTVEEVAEAVQEVLLEHATNNTV